MRIRETIEGLRNAAIVSSAWGNLMADGANLLEQETARADGLLPYVQHHVWCRSRLATTCDCGLTQLLGGS